MASVPSNFVDQGFGTSFTSGTAMAFAPDGRLFSLQQGGTVRVTFADGNVGTVGTVATTATGERGLLGIAFHPDFTSNGYVYLYYTATTPTIHNRISRFTVSGNTFVAGSETPIVDLETLSGATNHNGGAMAFGPDGKLYVAVGDNANSATAQSLTSRFGKILRYNPDGSIPGDNPTTIAGLSGTTSGAFRAIWAAGLRNPYTFAFQPGTGRMFINDVGEGAWEEVNVGGAGRNFGWPATEGFFTPGGTTAAYTPPFYAYQHGSGLQKGFAITGGAFYSSTAANAFPSAYQNKFFFGDFVNNWIGTIDPAGPAYTSATHSTAPNFASSTSGVVDIDVGPDGGLYYLQRGGVAGIRRIVSNFAPQAAIVTQPVSRAAFEGQSVTFFVETTGQSLQYQWQRNGTNIPGATSASYTLPNVQLSDNNAVFRVIVSNTLNSVTSTNATLTVSANSAPVPTISLPLLNSKYSAGQTLTFNGSGTDPEDGTLPASALTWQIDFHHADHAHPFLAPTTHTGTAMSVTIPTAGEVAANVFYRIYLTTTDSRGRTTTIYRDVLPNTATIRLATSGTKGYGQTTGPSTQLLLDGQFVDTGDNVAQFFSVLGVTGIQRTIGSIPSFTADGQTYTFQSWSDGGNATHTISTPATDTTYTAVYKDITAPVIASAVFSRDRATAGAPPHSLSFLFSEGIKPQGSSLTLLNHTTNQTTTITTLPPVSADARTARYTFAGLFADGLLPEGRYTATFAANGAKDLAGNVNANAFSLNFNVLAGDSNGDGDVDFNDLLALAANFNQTGRTYAQGNFNYSDDGTVDFADLLVLAGNFNRVLPAASTPLASALTSTGRKRTPGSAIAGVEI